MRQRILQVTKEAFNNIYGNAYLKGKYGDEWVEVMLKDLAREGTVVKFLDVEKKETKREVNKL